MTTAVIMMMIVATSIQHRITFAFPPKLVVSPSKLIYSSIRRPLTTSPSSSSLVVLQQQRGGGGANSDTTISATTSSNTFSRRTPSSDNNRSFLFASQTKLMSQMSASSDVLVDGLPTTTASSSSSNSNNDESKLTSLRALMKERNVDIYLVPSDDPHLSGKERYEVYIVPSLLFSGYTILLSNSFPFLILILATEYVPDAYMRRAYLSGFRGSAGTAVVTATDALLWTDSRYWNEASIQLDMTLWKLQKGGSPDVLTIPKWLGETAKEYYQQQQKPLMIGIDPYVHPASFAKEVNDIMAEIAKTENFQENPGVIQTLSDNSNEKNLVDVVWEKDETAPRPLIPVAPFRVHPLEYAGVSVLDKVESIRKEMNTKKATALVLCTLDDVAYTLNLRAQGDIDTCPVGIAYCMITTSTIDLYCDAQKVVNITSYMNDNLITVKPYDQIVNDVRQHCVENDAANKVWIDKSRANYALVSAVPETQCIDCQNPVTIMKACKNEAELRGMREAHIVDGVAMAKFMAWLEHEIIHKERSISEVEIDTVLTKYRAEQDGFLECSFPTIAGVGPNGAIIHYRAKEGNSLLKYLNRSAPILIDSGGQYTYGTTDVTRTWSFQEQPDPIFVDYYTRVLKGNIGLDSMIFPENIPGLVLDVYARKHLWDIGSDYGHGTGHGVGAALNVHEGPHSISPRYTNTEGLKIGMIVSNEPGYYEDNHFGIRIENLLEIQPVIVPSDEHANGGTVSTPPPSNKKKFLKFSKLTMIPIQKNLMDVSLLTESELDWIDQYHADVLLKVGSRLEENSPELLWLQKACSKMDRSLR